MPTGDGLLARLLPPAPVSLDVFAALCEASEAHGNGVMEVTQRGSLQIRGLTPSSAPAFAGIAVKLGLGEDDAPPILTSPLLGLEIGEGIDLNALAMNLRKELRNHPAIASIGPKVSLAIDGGGALHLDDVPADLRLRADTASHGAHLHVSLAGTAAAATELGWVEPRHAIEVVFRVLAGIAGRGAAARARDFANPADVRALRASLAGLILGEPRPAARPAAEPLGIHRLNDGRVAQGVALAFGYADASVLKRWVLAAACCGAHSIRPAPGRALLAIGLAESAGEEFAASAAAAGFVVRPDDARRYVVACSGAPACASALLSTRQLAAQIARTAEPLLDGSLTLHVSGCAKGCAHPGAAALTLVGPGSLVVQGRAADAPHACVSADDFVAGLPRLEGQRLRLPGGRERSADMMSRLGAARVLAAMRGAPAHD
jgi:precorrin-3B synthase